MALEQTHSSSQRSQTNGVESSQSGHDMEKSSMNVGQVVDDVPDGGFRAWLTVAGGWMVVFCTFGAIQSFGVYQDYYTRISLSEHPPSDISWIGSVQIFFLFAGGIVSGKLFDDGWFRELLSGGSLLYLISSFLLSLAKPHHYYQNFLAQAVGIGISMGIMFLPTLSVIAHYFRRRRAIAMGTILTGSSVGAVVYPIILNHLFHGTAGFAWGIRAVSFIDLILLVCANFMMKTRLSPHSSKLDIRGILKDVPFWIALIGITLTFWGLFVPFFYLQLFAAKHNLSQTLQTYCVSILNAAGFFGRIVPMYFADRYGPFNVIVPITVASGGLVFAFLGGTSPGGLLAFAIIYGFFSGGFVSVSAPVAASFSRDLGEVGTRIGLMTFGASFGLLTGNPISGALLHPPRYTWVQPMIFSAIVVLAGAACLAVARYMQVKRKGTSRI